MPSYLQIRGLTLVARVVIPADIRPYLGTREIIQPLPTASKREAAPAALELAARCKRVFAEIREHLAMTDTTTPEELDPAEAQAKNDRLLELVERKRHELRIAIIKTDHATQIEAQDQRHRAELALAKAQAELAGMRAILDRLGTIPAPVVPAPIPEPEPVAEVAPEPVKAEPKGPRLKEVVDGFLDRYRKDQKPAMYRKHKPVLNMLVDVVGNKPVAELKQQDLNEFFDLVTKLPPRWADTCRREGISVRALARRKHEVTLSPKAFEDTYLASVRPFMKAARLAWQDQGWPSHLTCEGVQYGGDREGGEDKQRAFTRAELERLFHGPELQAAASDPSQEHEFWLPAVGLFSGARVNEICQINPQTDVGKDEETGIDYLLISEDGDTHEGVIKSVKTGISRKVPIHSRLVELGFLAYVERIRKTGAKMLFPQWKPSKGRASGEAEKWFRRLLEELKLRDDTPGKRIVGYHAWRHTLLTTANNAKPQIDATPISGHVGKEDAVVRGYQSELALIRKREILEAIPFEIDLTITRKDATTAPPQV